ncbi:HIT domain-containing protein [Aestuariivivens sediminicola]|uniref:HIT domain-containing protein n=1 Tax=Aestuariivivens sediminicola TaxID=2913560 RepID=UPI001F57EE3D|nr:HIT domain-containing protein [Aestuariivivens sediminicola]
MQDIRKYIEEKMSMSHIYQPVMIKTLLELGGTAHKTEIAKKILSYDFSQIEYYERITNNMVGRVLRKNGVIEKDKSTYHLLGFNKLSQQEIKEIIVLCELKISDYIKKRGLKIWEHRRRNRKAVPGSIRYTVLKRAKGRCELCGISKDEKALEVDHIVPKNKGGEDTLDNYQALCYTCNANKGDRDDTDFRNLNAPYGHRLDDCIFCSISKDTVLKENELALAIYDNFPITKFHVLLIPKRHCIDFFELSQAEINAITRLSHEIKSEIIEKDSTIDGFNIGYNIGEVAGQTIMHCHMHMIPRRKNDVINPKGGIRAVIPGKADYTN